MIDGERCVSRSKGHSMWCSEPSEQRVKCGGGGAKKSVARATDPGNMVRKGRWTERERKRKEERENGKKV